MACIRISTSENGGQLLVLAGPGSDKTVVLALQIVRLLEEYENASALALTSTNKATAEMRDRADRRLGSTPRPGVAQPITPSRPTFSASAAGIWKSGQTSSFSPKTKTESPVLRDVIRELSGGDDELLRDRTNLLHLLDRLFSESYRARGRRRP